MLAAGLGGREGDDPWTWSLTVHGPSEFFDVYRQALAEKVRDADAVIAISDFARSQLMSLVDEQHWDKIEVVHCGVPPEVFTPDAKPSADRHEGPLRILNVARMAPTKGHVILVQAVDRLEREGVAVDVVLAGDGPRRTALESMVRARGLEHRIRFVGAVGQDRIRSLYSWADVFCLPSFAEGVPVVLMEAMAMELPVIATRVAGVAELVESGHSGYVLAPGRVDDLVAAIGQLAADPALRQAMGRRGRRTVVEGFSVEENAARLLDILRERTSVSSVPAPIRSATSAVVH
jgi:glycosyltransferase involved in cell wall biosynthesis